MKKIFLLAPFVIALLFSSCKKDDTQPTASTIPFPTNSGISSIALNGGNVMGRWTVTYEEYNSYQNNVLTDSDSTYYTAGEAVVNFLSGGNMLLIDAGDTVTGTYSVSGNQLTLTILSDVITFSFGINNQGTMRWHESSQTTVGSDVFRDDDDYLLVRY